MTETEYSLSNHTIQTVDSSPIESVLSSKIIAALQSRGFKAQDIGHHIVVNPPKAYEDQEPWNCAVIYLDGDTLWIKAIAERWWGLFDAWFKEEDAPSYLAF